MNKIVYLLEKDTNYWLKHQKLRKNKITMQRLPPPEEE
jgi:hypothetical protein